MLHHIEIYVSNLKKSKEYYDLLLPLLGYELLQNWDSGFSYKEKQGQCYIVFVQTPKKNVFNNYNRTNTGLNHLAFSVDTTMEVDKLRRILKDKGIKELYEDRYPFAGGNQHYAFFFEDPDRIKLEIVGLNIK